MVELFLFAIAALLFGIYWKASSAVGRLRNIEFSLDQMAANQKDLLQSAANDLTGLQEDVGFIKTVARNYRDDQPRRSMIDDEDFLSEE